MGCENSTRDQVLYIIEKIREAGCEQVMGPSPVIEPTDAWVAVCGLGLSENGVGRHSSLCAAFRQDGGCPGGLDPRKIKSRFLI